MMWLVRLALNRPYTFVVCSLLILILSVVAILRTPTDIFPNINIPVISAIWVYNGLNPQIWSPSPRIFSIVIVMSRAWRPRRWSSAWWGSTSASLPP